VLDLAGFQREQGLRGELESALSRAITGTRLPLTPMEAPHPLFSFGRLFYGPVAASGSLAGSQPTTGPVVATSAWDQLLPRWLWPALEAGQASRLLEMWLRAVPAGELERAAADFQARWTGDGLGAYELLSLLRVLFNEVSLSPWTDLVDKVVRLLGLLERGGVLSAADVIDFESYLLRLVCRHLTAYDLVTFHHRGANYPDALLLDAVLADYLARLEQTPLLFEGEAARLRRRALRQAYLLRRRYEGHPVPDVPTSPGEHLRVFPNRYPRVPEEQVLQPASRQRRLFDGDPLLARLGPTARAVLRQSVADQEHLAEVQELGAAIFLDRPFGGGKAAVEPDGTQLLASLAYSRSIAGQRLRLLGGDLNLGAADLQLLEKRLALPGLGLESIGPPVRPGTVSLADAARAAPDFVFRHTLPGSVLALTERFEFGRLRRRLEGRVLLAAAVDGGGLVVYDAGWRPVLTLVPCLERGYASRHGLEYPAAGLLVTRLDGAALAEPVRLAPR
jgi:hypothetical protein